MSDDRRYQNRYGRYHNNSNSHSNAGGRHRGYYSSHHNQSMGVNRDMNMSREMNRDSRLEGGYRGNNTNITAPSHSTSNTMGNDHYNNSNNGNHYGGGGYHGRYNNNRGGYYNNSNNTMNNTGNRYYQGNTHMTSANTGIPTRPSYYNNPYPTQPSGANKDTPLAAPSSSSSPGTSSYVSYPRHNNTNATYRHRYRPYNHSYNRNIPSYSSYSGARPQPPAQPVKKEEKKIDTKKYSISTMAQGYLEIMDPELKNPSELTSSTEVDEKLKDINCQIFKTMCELAVVENQYARDTLNVQLTQEKLDTLLLS